jgi:hypothetical protein
VSDPKVTTEVLWRGALALAALDAVLVPLLARRIGRERLRRLKWTFAATAATYWCAIWVFMNTRFWASVYGYVFPAWARWLIPPAYALLFAAVALGTWWLALRLPGNAAVSLCLLGGVWGALTHVWAISRGIMDKPPMLHGASPAAAVVIATFEFTFYWCVMLGVAALVQGHLDRRRDAGHG